jgi:pseudaminic acid synthase
MISRFGLVTGLSDHTMGFIAPVVAVSLGAKIIENILLLTDLSVDLMLLFL